MHRPDGAQRDSNRPRLVASRSAMAGLLCALIGLFMPLMARADLTESLAGLGSTSRSTIRDTIQELAALNDPAAIPALQALLDRRLYVDESGALYEEVVATDGGESTWRTLPAGELVAEPPADLREPRLNNGVRRVLAPTIDLLKLQSDDTELRLSAATSLAERVPDSAVPAMRTALETEADPRVRKAIELGLAERDISSDDPALRLSAVELLGRAGDRGAEGKIRALLATDDGGEFAEPDEAVRAAAKAALSRIEIRSFFVDSVGNLLYGLSLASVLLLAALGLAITFGLMRVINMAHGEMIMIGAYSTYVVQTLFLEHAAAWSDAYIVAAVPAAFVTCGMVGMLLERLVIRHLYGRPLETLLATWGISLILIQIVRQTFGAQNVEVANPSWLSGGYELFTGVVLPYSRISIVVFAAATVTVVWFLLQRTPLGLQVRAVTQNREMASCLGISTRRVDMWTFGLGSAIAGLGGVALSQIGNVGPELGQGYIVDSFLVVVVGGVGKIAGAVLAALSLGVVNKLLEPVAGAVFGKIIVLVFIILFIQRRPQGIFALKGRAAEA